jgi:L-asparaginase / beta-aspartyl-peptidase
MSIEKMGRRVFIGAIMSMASIRAASSKGKKACIVIHGGAGTILRSEMTVMMETAYRNTLENSLRAGQAILDDGGKSLDAVEAAIRVLEDSPLFNAGKGAVFNSAGEHELDASIMDGKTLAAGAVAGVRSIKNPITAARAVMEKSPHVMLIAAGAEEFARAQGIEQAAAEYFFEERRWKQFQKAKEAEKQALDHSGFGGAPSKFGTVGAVALDLRGNIAAGTSTGGMTNKKFGRVGDSPIIGAGTYADNRTCGVSCTGHGEYFIRAAAAHDISALVAYKGWTVQRATNEVIQRRVGRLGGAGGAIALDGKGNVAMSFNTPGMYRGFMKTGAEAQTFIFKKG